MAALIFPAFVLAIAGLALLGAALEPSTSGLVMLAYYTAALAATYTAVAALERVLPHRTTWLRPQGDVRTDVTHLAVTGPVASQTGLVLVGALVWLVHETAPRTLAGRWPAGWPMLAQLALALLVSELGHYWFHRLTHERPLLWRLHAVHHSAPRLYWLNATRFHPLDLFGLTVCQSLPLVLLGITPEAFVAYAIFAGCYGQLQHANIALYSGRLRWLFSTPELHRWHHSVDPHEGNTNYGAILSTWDIALGTFFWPRDRSFDGPVGVRGMPDFPRRYIDQLRVPFRWHELAEGGR